MKMSITCLYWSSELGSLLSIVHVYLLSILKVTFSKSRKLWFFSAEDYTNVVVLDQSTATFQKGWGL